MRAIPILVILTLAAPAWAVTYTKRPTGDALQFVAQHADGTVNVCMFAVGTDYLDPAKHLGCTPMGGQLQITSAYPIARGEGDIQYRAVAVDSAGRISEPSTDAYLVQDIPLPPVLE